MVWGVLVRSNSLREEDINACSR